MDMDTKADKPVVQHRVKTRTPADPATVEIVVMRKIEGSTTYWYNKGQINWVPTDDGVEVEPLLVLTKAEATELMRSLWNRGIRIVETEEVKEAKPDPRQPGPVSDEVSRHLVALRLLDYLSKDEGTR